MYPCHGVGREFDEIKKENKNTLRLSKYGDSLLNKFITQNTKRETSLRQKEKDLWDYLHSKPPLKLNKWKPSNHIKVRLEYQKKKETISPWERNILINDL